MSYFRRAHPLPAPARAIIASAAVATLVAMVCSVVLELRGWPPHFVPRSQIIGDAGGSWGAPWEALARTPTQYQGESLRAIVRTVGQIGICALVIAALSLLMHAVSLIMGQWHQLAIRCALGAALRSLLVLVGRELLVLGALGCALGALAGGLAITALRASWPAVLSTVPLAPNAAVTAALALLAVSLLLGAIALLLLTLLHRGGRLAAQLQGTHVTRSAGLHLVQSALAASQLAALLVVTYACTLILDAGTLPQVARAGTDAERLLVAPARIADASRPAPARVVAYRQALAALPQGRGHGVALSSPDAWLGLGKELPVIAFCGECRMGVFPMPMTSARVRVVAMSPDVLAPLVTYRGRGRDFSLADTAGARRTAVLNQAAASRLFPAGNPLGKTIRAGLTDDMSYTVVGITPVQVPEIFGNPPNTPAMFVSVLQHPPTGLEVSSPADKWSLASRLAAAAPPDALRIHEPRTLAQRLRDFVAPIQWFAMLFAGLTIAATGTATYALVAAMNEMVRLRECDIAIRMAVGATARDIERWVTGRTVWITVAGALIGLSGARWVGVLLRGPDDVGDIGLLGALLLGFGALGVVASWLPARRAARIQPAAIWAKKGLR